MDRNKEKQLITQIILKSEEQYLLLEQLQCLAENTQFQLKPHYDLDSSLAFIECQNKNCQFQTDFGGLSICCCAIRRKIFDKYGV